MPPYFSAGLVAINSDLAKKFSDIWLDVFKEIDQKKLTVEIEIDGGINFDNAKIAKKAGVDILVSGTTIFKNNKGDIKKNIETLRNH